MKCIKDEKGKVLVQDKDIKDRWKNYFHKLFNDSYKILSESNRLDIGDEDQNYTFYPRSQEREVKEALKMMVNGKAVGPYNIAIGMEKSWR